MCETRRWRKRHLKLPITSAPENFLLARARRREIRKAWRFGVMAETPRFVIEKRESRRATNSATPNFLFGRQA